MTETRAFTVQETARTLKVREARIREEIHAGRLRAARIGRLWRIPAEALEEYLEARMAPAGHQRKAASP